MPSSRGTGNPDTKSWAVHEQLRQGTRPRLYTIIASSYNARHVKYGWVQIELARAATPDNIRGNPWQCTMTDSLGSRSQKHCNTTIARTRTKLSLVAMSGVIRVLKASHWNVCGTRWLVVENLIVRRCSEVKCPRSFTPSGQLLDLISGRRLLVQHDLPILTNSSYTTIILNHIQTGIQCNVDD
jgi:hypothetical protein